MKPADFQKLAGQHGGVSGVSVVDPHVETETPNIDPTGQPIKSKTPNPTPKYKYVFNDGTEMTAITDQAGDIQVADPGTAMKPTATTAQQNADTTAASQAETARHNVATEQADADQRKLAVEQQKRANDIAAGRLSVDQLTLESNKKMADLDQQVKAGTLDLARRRQVYDEWWKTYVERPMAMAQEARLARAGEQSYALGSRRAAVDELTFGEGAGKNASDRAITAYKARREARVLGAWGGGGDAQAGARAAVEEPFPDIDTIATDATRKSLAMLGITGGTGGAQPTQTVPVAAGTPAAAAAAPAVAAATIPPPPAPMAAAVAPAPAQAETEEEQRRRMGLALGRFGQ